MKPYFFCIYSSGGVLSMACLFIQGTGTRAPLTFSLVYALVFLCRCRKLLLEEGCKEGSGCMHRLPLLGFGLRRWRLRWGWVSFRLRWLCWRGRWYCSIASIFLGGTRDCSQGDALLFTLFDSFLCCGLSWSIRAFDGCRLIACCHQWFSCCNIRYKGDLRDLNFLCIWRKL
jgi:hypothetical protein